MCHVLPAETIKEAILHTGEDVRQVAVSSSARSHSHDPAIMPQVIRAIERFGVVALADYAGLKDLTQTVETAAWLIREIERLGPGVSESDKSHRAALAAALRRADAAVLKRHTGAIKSMRHLDDFSQDLIARRMLFEATDADALWRRLIAFCDARVGQRVVTDRDYEMACALSAALARHSQFVAERIQAILVVEPSSRSGWLDTLAARLAGELRLEAANTSLVKRLDGSGTWMCEEAHVALVRIGTDAVVEELGKRFASNSSRSRIEAASLLASIPTCSSMRKCLDLLEDVQEPAVREQLLLTLLQNFTSAGIEPARAYVNSTAKSPGMLDVRAALFLACKLLGETFPKFDLWLADSKTDDEFRRKWFQEHRQISQSGRRTYQRHVLV